MMTTTLAILQGRGMMQGVQLPKARLRVEKIGAIRMMATGPWRKPISHTRSKSLLRVSGISTTLLKTEWAGPLQQQPE